MFRGALWKRRLLDRFKGLVDLEIDGHALRVVRRKNSRHRSASTRVSGAAIADTLQDLTAHEISGHVFTRVEFADLLIEGKLRLNGLGTESEPLISFMLQGCTLDGGLDAAQSFLEGVEIRECTLTMPGGSADPGDSGPLLSFVGAHVSNQLQLTSLEIGTPHAVIDCSFAHIGAGCEFTDVGVAWNGQEPSTAEERREYPLGRIRFAGATVTGELLLAGVAVAATDGKALSGDELTVKGSMQFASGKQRTSFLGEVSLMGAHIHGQLSFKGVEMTALKDAEERREEALTAENIRVEGDLFFRSHGADSCKVCGVIDLISARIEGDLQFYGIFDADNRIRAIKARAAEIAGAVHLGWASDDAHACEITGECDLTNARIAGRLVVGAADVKLTPTLAQSQLVGRRNQQYALNLTGATIQNDLRLESTASRCCRVEGIGLTGGTVGGRLLLRGAHLCVEQQAHDGAAVVSARRKGVAKERKALSANGSTIRGGISAGADPYCGRCCEIEGDIRLRNATINGPVIFRGVSIRSTGSKGVALWATNTHFGSDVIFGLEPEALPLASETQAAERSERPCCVQGEVKLAGSTIDGSLLLKGAVMCAGASGAALDCYRITVKSNIFFGNHEQEGETGGTDRWKARPTVLLGMVNLEFAQTTSMTLGAESPRPIVQPEVAPDAALELYGSVVMRGMEIRGTMMIVDAKLCPSTDFKIPEAYGNASAMLPAQSLLPAICRAVEGSLKRHSVYRLHSVLHAIYAKLGTRMYVRLNQGSRGLIDLYGASTGTIGSLFVKEQPHRNGNASGGNGEESGQPQHHISEDWGRRPEHRDDRWAIALDLGEFTYKYLNDRPEPLTENPLFSTRRAVGFRCIGRPTRAQLQPRYDWLSQQIDVTNIAAQEGTSPQRQIARVYRETGNLSLANLYSIERRWIQANARSRGDLRKYLEWLFGVFFGFGYSSSRALGSVALLFLLSFFFIWVAAVQPKPPGPASYPQTGLLVDATQRADSQISTCALLGKPWLGIGESWIPTAIEAGKVILPFTRFEKDSGCVLDARLHEVHRYRVRFLRPWHAVLSLLSWIVFPLAAVTITGLLRESTP